ncbi:MAG: transglutaminase family protein [Geobacter sp.]|nr:transglutaminase family protein [Geobacter sp.]
MKKILSGLLVVLLHVSVASAKTLILEGELESSILLSQQIGFAVDKPVDTLTFKFAMPAQFSNKGVKQDLVSKMIKFRPEPAEVEDVTDSFGNSFKKVTWNRLKQDVSINMQFETRVRSALSAMTSKAEFPLTGLAAKEKVFLKRTDMVQSSDNDIAELSKTLTGGAATEFEAVSSILNFIADNIKYTYNPVQYDAKYTLANRSGNCQNFAHLSMALLRAAGIPARIVGGISLKEQWKVPIDEERSVVQGMGQGGHAWMEIYFPDLGWLSYDPQQSRQFTSSRHIKQTHGLDSTDINDTWSAAPYLPAYSESIDAKFLEDRIDVKLKGSDVEPRPYLVSNSVKLAQSEPSGDVVPVIPPVAAGGTVPPLVVSTKPDLPAKKPAPPTKKPETKKPSPPKPVLPPPAKKPAHANYDEFGNMEFPNLVDTFRITGSSAMKVLDKETSEYVTSTNVYAQAIKFENDFSMEKVSLALHRFGGDGTLMLDFVEDVDGKPSLTGLRSDPVYLDKIGRKPGYYWVDFNFRFPEGTPQITKGKYWIILRHYGDAIVNWFYIPGKPYSGGDDTRSTAKGYKWEDILNYDFVFKVRGRVKTAKP